MILSLDNALPITMVQYRGSYPLMTDLVSSRIDMAMISYIVAQPFIQAHKIKILAQDGATRWSGMPDMPTMIESGQLKKKASGWFAVSAPAGTPKAIVDRLNSEFIMASQRAAACGATTGEWRADQDGDAGRAACVDEGGSRDCTAAGEVAWDGSELMR